MTRAGTHAVVETPRGKTRSFRNSISENTKSEPRKATAGRQLTGFRHNDRLRLPFERRNFKVGEHLWIRYCLDRDDAAVGDSDPEDEAARHYDETALSAPILEIGVINTWNRLNAAVRQVAGDWG